MNPVLVDDVAHEGIQLVRRFVHVPVQGLVWVVLLLSQVGQVGDSSNSVREVCNKPAIDGVGFALGGIGW